MKGVYDGPHSLLVNNMDLRDAVAATPGLRALFMTGAPEGFYVGQNLADLNFYALHGHELVSVEGYDIQSWESFGEVDADVIFVDNRAIGWLQPDQLEDQVPTWSLQPAVQAGQVYPWQNEYVPSYAGFSPVMPNVAIAIQDANLVD